MKKLGMRKSLLVTRLTELNQQLVTIAELQKMEDEYDKNPVLHSKICDCPHHMSSIEENKKKIPCNVNTCKTRRCICSCKCNKTSKSYKNVEKVKDNSHEQTHDNETIKEDAHTTEIGQVLETRLENVQDLEKINSYIQENMDDGIVHKINNVVNTSSEILLQDNDKSKKPEEIITSVDNNQNRTNIFSKRSLERIQKDLSNEKKQKKDLEEKLQSAKEHLIKLKKDSEEEISNLKDALKKAEEELVLAKNETNAVTEDRDKLLEAMSILKKEMNNVVDKNASLCCECQNLKFKLQTASECEMRTCTVVQDEINGIKNIFKQKEDILQAEIIELKGLITELTNVTKIQERRICELTNICKKQQCSLHNKSKTIIDKESKLSDMQSLLKSYGYKCTKMQNDIENLESTLNKESVTCNNLKDQLERFKDDYNCMLNIKTKIIEEQDETIKKQKRLLQNSEIMAQQAASEFEEIRNELVHEKETCESLRIALITAEAQLNEKYNIECKNCSNLTAELNLLEQQKQKTLIAAKEAVQKLCVSVRHYQRQFVLERQQCKFLVLKLKEKQEEVEYIMKEFAYRKKTIVRKTSDFLS
ncbi:hypothetical protein M0802_001791 [Mischocyttarus mexicanus]|nr:hypothetical protein M0802_001791 [Mischocyttarus mexicanus]